MKCDQKVEYGTIRSSIVKISPLYFQKFFEDSLILQLYWEGKIDLIEGKSYIFEKKITFMSLVRKYFGKKMRDFLSSIKKIIK